MVSPEEVIDFWIEEVGPTGWYKSEEALDDEIRDRFEAAWDEAREGHYAHWLSSAEGFLAFIILTDQFPRNMFRGSGKSFATDKLALAAAKNAIDHGHDLRIDEPQRQFFYMPLMHSENLCDQDRCVRLMKQRMPSKGGDNLLHAKVHREIIRKFGRFPYRNDALHRRATPPEEKFISNGGYGEEMQRLRAS